MNRRIRQALLLLAPALLVTMSAAPASAARPNADDPTAALKAEINQLYASEPGLVGRTHKMQAFIMELALHAKTRNPDFKVIPQDAAQLAFVDGDVTKGVLPGLISLVDGWGKEGVLLSGDGITPTNDQLAYLELANNGLMVTETSTVNSSASSRSTTAGPRTGGSSRTPASAGRWPSSCSPASAGRRTVITSGSRTRRRSVSATGSTAPGTSST